jgi:type I restriction enzyme M protein
MLPAIQWLRSRRVAQTQQDDLDIFWLRDESLEDSANLPDPDVLALEIAEELEAALEQFAAIAEDLKR